MEVSTTLNESWKGKQKTTSNDVEDAGAELSCYS